MEWKKLQRVGFSVRDMQELERVVAIGANMAEIKLEKFAQSGKPIYFFEDGKFRINDSVARGLEKFARAKDVEIQFHLPIETGIDKNVETGFNMGLTSHHDAIMERYIMLEEIWRRYGIGRTLTLHPPLVSLKGVDVVEEKDAITNAKIFFDRWDFLRLEENHETLVGVENQTDIKHKAGNLGYLPIHFRRMLKDTRTIGITIDTGHRRLAQEFSIREFLQIGLVVNNFHFHGNDGKFDPYDWKDDQHLLPDEDNVMGYRNYLRYFRRHRAPIVLEISRLDRYSDDELGNFLARFKKELQ